GLLDVCFLEFTFLTKEKNREHFRKSEICLKIRRWSRPALRTFWFSLIRRAGTPAPKSEHQIVNDPTIRPIFRIAHDSCANGILLHVMPLLRIILARPEITIEIVDLPNRWARR